MAVLYEGSNCCFFIDVPRKSLGGRKRKMSRRNSRLRLVAFPFFSKLFFLLPLLSITLFMSVSLCTSASFSVLSPPSFHSFAFSFSLPLFFLFFPLPPFSLSRPCPLLLSFLPSLRYFLSLFLLPSFILLYFPPFISIYFSLLSLFLPLCPPLSLSSSLPPTFPPSPLPSYVPLPLLFPRPAMSQQLKAAQTWRSPGQ